MKIGKKAVDKLSGLVKKVLCYDAFPSDQWINTVPNAEYVPMEELLASANFISIHCPLLPETYHLINAETIQKMKRDVIIVNTSRGEVIDTKALVDGLKSEKIYGAALDVFENESNFIWRDMTRNGFKHFPDLQELAQMDNVIMSSHVAFYTDESIQNITMKSLSNFEGFLGKVKLDESAFID